MMKESRENTETILQGVGAGGGYAPSCVKHGSFIS